MKMNIYPAIIAEDRLLRYNTLTLSIVIAGAVLSLSKTEDDGGGQNAREEHDVVVVGDCFDDGCV